MTIGTLLLSLTGIILGTNGQLLERAPIPGVVSVPYSRSSPQLQKRDAVVEAAFGSLEAPYIVNITAGTPPQPITVSLDTGSSDLVLRTGESTFCMAEPAGVCPGVGYCKSTTRRETSN
jgi:Eukaryotic aspartyl protease